MKNLHVLLLPVLLLLGCTNVLAVANGFSTVAKTTVNQQAEEATTAFGTHIFHISDMHYDPFFGTPLAVHECTSNSTPYFGMPGCDTSKELMVQAVEEMYAEAKVNKASMVLYTGDWCRHKMKHLFKHHKISDPHPVMSEIVHEVASVLAEHAKEVPTLIHPNVLNEVIGNEDFFPNYGANVDAPVHPLLVNYSKSFVSTGLMSAVEAQQFQLCGFYTKEMGKLSGTRYNLNVLNLNTVIYDYRLRPHTHEADPCGQFAYMRAQLEHARATPDQKVYIIAHVPPTTWFMFDRYVEMYLNLTNEFKDVIAGEFYGHTHQFKYHTTPNYPTFIAGGITRYSHTFPSFYSYQVSQYLTVSELTQYTFSEMQKSFREGFHLKSALGIDELTSSKMRDATNEMLKNGTEFMNYYIMHQGGSTSSAQAQPCDDRCVRSLVCQLNCFYSSQVYVECKSSHKKHTC